MSAMTTGRTRGRRAVFLDRDGTLIEEKGYLRRPEEVVLEREAGECVARLNRCGFPVIVLTNQSGIARGYYTEEALSDVHRALREKLAAIPAALDGIYACPHHPEGVVERYRVHCRCRKPAPGLVERAVRDLGVTAPGSYMVGDKRSDVELGLGMEMTSILVRTGYGQEEWRACLQEPDRARPHWVAEDLREAVRRILWIEHRREDAADGGAAHDEEVQDWSSKWVGPSALAGVLGWHRARGHRVVLANGIFDLLHAGHVGYLQAAREQGDVLVVALNDDGSARRLKGAGRPVLPVEERLEIVSALAAVDYCVVFGEDTADRVVATVRPDVHVKGTDYTEETVPERRSVTGVGGRVRIVGPPKRRGTRDIVRRIREG